MGEPTKLPRSNLRSLALLGGFAAWVMALPLLSVSLSAFVVVAVVLVTFANIAFLRAFDIRRFTAAATLITFNLLVADATAVIILAFLAPQSSAADYLISAIPVPAIAYPIMQAFFLRDHWR